MSPNLTTITTLPDGVRRPGYTPSDHAPGIVHLGLGAFHKAHQAVYTDDALAAEGGDWRITGVSLRSTAPAETLTPQNGLFTVLERDAEGTQARVIGAISNALCLTTDREGVLNSLCDPATKIVSITVTEKGYGIDRASGGIDAAHPAVAADLKTPDHPIGVAGLLVWALKKRRAAGVPPLTLLRCDNLPENGRMLRDLVLDFAKRTAPDLVSHIETDIGFPSTMVDRITPAQGDTTLALAEQMIDHRDAAAIETERFRQWVIEDDFRTGRPAWEAGGAIFAADVRPYELMKLRMLNGAHSMMAYTGFLAGHRHVRDVMEDPALVRLVERHLGAAAATLRPLDGMDFGDYARQLLARFANPHLAHETYQIAMDGTEKLPQRIFAPAIDALRLGQPLDPFTFATAAWMRYAVGRRDNGEAYDLRDPKEAMIGQRLKTAKMASEIVEHLDTLPGFVSAELRDVARWKTSVTEKLDRMLENGVQNAVAHELDQ